MQNIDPRETQIVNTNKETSETEIIKRASSAPRSIDNISNDPEYVIPSSVVAANLEGQPESAPETSSAKNKIRSRFSAAIRKLSKSKRKKDKLTKSASALPEPSDSVLSSGGEETTFDFDAPATGSRQNFPTKTKKKKLSKRFLLSRLKRTKICPRNENDLTNDHDDRSGVVRVSNLQTYSAEALNHQPENQSPPALTAQKSRPSLVSELVTGGSLQCLERIRKVQITISGRKIESTQSANEVKGNESVNALTIGTTTEDDLTGNLKKFTEAHPTESSTPHSQKIFCRSSERGDATPASPGSPPSTIAAVTELGVNKGKKTEAKSKKITSTFATNANVVGGEITEANIYVDSDIISTSKSGDNTNISEGSNTTITATITTTITTTTTTTTSTVTNIITTTTITTSTTNIATPSVSTNLTFSHRTPFEEKYIITQTKCDAPPHELAPAKPSRSIVVISATSQSTASTGAIPKVSIRPTTLTNYKLLWGVPSRSVLRKSGDASQTFIDTESDLMQNLQGVIERGHRFPKPTATTTITTTTSNASIPIQTTEPISTNTDNVNDEILETAATTSTAKSNPQQRQKQIKFHLESSTPSIELSQTSTASPPPPQVKSVGEDQFADRNSMQIAPEQPTTFASISSTTSTIQSRAATSAPLPIRSILPSEQLYLTPRISSAGEIGSVGFTHSNDQDDNISSAESAQTNQKESPNSFGSPSRSNLRNYRRISGGYALAQQEYSIKSLQSSDSQDPITESKNRKRIPFVAQPSLYDDYDRDPEREYSDRIDNENDHVESRREALSYIFSAVSDYSVDSDIDQGDNQMPAFGDLTMDQGEPPIMTPTIEKREHLYKILVIGELGTGKTSFIKRYVHQFFSQNYRATIGVDFALKVIHWDANTIVRLQLWDIAGQERFGNMTRVYYKEAVGAFIVFDVTRQGTFDCVSKWKEDLDSKVQLPDGSPIPCILLANKCDQDKQGIVAIPEKIDEYVRENGFAGWFETSAKENINIDEAAKALVNKILLNDKLISDSDLTDNEKFNLNTPETIVTTTDSKSKCSC